MQEYTESSCLDIVLNILFTVQCHHKIVSLHSEMISVLFSHIGGLEFSSSPRHSRKLGTCIFLKAGREFGYATDNMTLQCIDSVTSMCSMCLSDMVEPYMFCLFTEKSLKFDHS